MLETEKQQLIFMKDRKIYKHRYTRLWTNSSYLSKFAATVKTNRDVNFSFALCFPQKYIFGNHSIHFSEVKKSHTKYKEHLNLMTEDILLNVEKQKSYSKVIQSYPKWTFLETQKKFSYLIWLKK